jgi:predicted 2-oxoglutarate/Fe(II)-dependent dioxygenase YbiX
MIVFILVSLLIICILLRPKYQEPRVLRNVFTSEMCDSIIELATPKLTRSEISLNKDIDTTIRDSETAWLKPESSDVVRRVMQKCVAATDRQFINTEYLQVLKYKPGGFYKPHQDAFKSSVEKNPRLYTCIVALNDDYEGGETSFPNLGKDFKLNKGDVLLFNTLNDWGLRTEKALHGGKPVISGEKWICNLWIHRHPYEQRE